MLGLTPGQEHEWYQTFSPAMLTEFKRFQNNLKDVLEHDVRYHGDGVHLLYIRIIINMSIIPELASIEVRAGKYRIGAESGWVEPTIGESSPEPAPLCPAPTGDLPPPLPLRAATGEDQQSVSHAIPRGSGGRTP